MTSNPSILIPPGRCTIDLTRISNCPQSGVRGEGGVVRRSDAPLVIESQRLRGLSISLLFARVIWSRHQTAELWRPSLAGVSVGLGQFKRGVLSWFGKVPEENETTLVLWEDSAVAYYYNNNVLLRSSETETGFFPLEVGVA